MATELVSARRLCARCTGRDGSSWVSIADKDGARMYHEGCYLQVQIARLASRVDELESRLQACEAKR